MRLTSAEEALVRSLIANGSSDAVIERVLPGRFSPAALASLRDSLKVENGKLITLGVEGVFDRDTSKQGAEAGGQKRGEATGKEITA